MAIAVSDTDTSVADGTGYTAGSGSNRVIVWGTTSGNTSHTVTGATIGGNAMSQLTSSGSANAIQSSLFYVLEAIVATLSGSQTCDSTYNTAPGNNVGGAVTLTGVSQGAILDSKVGITASGSSHSLTAINVVAGGIVLVEFGVGGATVGLPSGYTQVMINTGSNPRSAFVYKLISADGTEQPVFTSDAAVVGRLAEVSFSPAAAGFRPAFAQGSNRIIGMAR